MFDIKTIVCLFYVEKMGSDVQGMLVFRKWEIIYSPKFLKSIWYKLSWPLSQAWVTKHLWEIWQRLSSRERKVLYRVTIEFSATISGKVHILNSSCRHIRWNVFFFSSKARTLPNPNTTKKILAQIRCIYRYILAIISWHIKYWEIRRMFIL